MSNIYVVTLNILW